MFRKPDVNVVLKIESRFFCLVTQPVSSPVCPLIGNSVQSRVLFQGKHDETGKQVGNPPKVLIDAEILFGMMLVKDFFLSTLVFWRYRKKSNKVSQLYNSKLIVKFNEELKM